MNETTLDPKTMSLDDIKQVLADVSLKMQENERLFKEYREEREKELKQREKEREKEREEFDRQMKESDLRMQESDRKLKDRIDELTTRFTSQSGHILEGLMEPSAIKMFQDRGYDINRCWKNFKKHVKGIGKKLEVDLLLLDDEIAIIVEVKINCTKQDIDHFISQMQSFKEICPEYADKEIMLAIAAINYDRDADKYAHERGLFVIRVYDNRIFALDPNDGDTMIKL
ncbi:MAG: hypothetical protein J5644_10930 [Bacteroidales bacterium]|nr:hypothetical protein [Bacteroidales bacterium]